MPNDDFLAVLDFGSQYAHLIAKRIRHLGVYTEIFPPSIDIDSLRAAKGIILSGGPASVFVGDVPAFNPEILSISQFPDVFGSFLDAVWAPKWPPAGDTKMPFGGL